MTHLWLVRVECTEGAEEDFARWYDEEHLPELLKIDGVRSAQRYASADPLGDPDPRRWLVVYELQGDLDEIRGRIAAGRGNRTLHPAFVREASVSEFFTPAGLRLEDDR
jgi:hypothetical protein